MFLPDVNVLVSAFRRDHDHHQLCRRWLNDLVERETSFGISPLALSAAVRITTNPRVFRIPSPLDEAFAFCDNLLDRPECFVIEPGERHWQIFRQLCVATSTRGSTVSDVWFAALALESGCEWVTLDRDYARFPGLKWRAPAA